MPQDILSQVKPYLVGDELACADAHTVAQALNVEPIEIGRAVTGTSIRFFRCQLGLFGFGPKAEGKSKIVLAAQNVPDEIAAALQARAVNGRVPCLAVWEIADEFKYPRLGIANIVERLGLRIAPCQLGCF